MSKKMASIILTYGIILAILGILVWQFAHAHANISLITGTAGGGLCLLWGIIALTGDGRRTRAVLTMIAVAAVLLSQMVQAWLSSAEGASLAGQAILTLMFLMTLGMLIYLLHGERTPEFYNTSAKDTPSRGEHPRPTQK